MIWLQFAQDGGFALRMLRRMPAFTATAILTLAIGIGMTAAVSSVFMTSSPRICQRSGWPRPGLRSRLIGAVVPALRAARIDPAETLR